LSPGKTGVRVPALKMRLHKNSIRTKPW